MGQILQDRRKPCAEGAFRAVCHPSCGHKGGSLTFHGERRVGASIVTGSDGMILELGTLFLGIDPSDAARIEEAGQLAVTTLARWDS